MIKNEINIPDELIRAVMNCKEGAAELLMITLYNMLTNRTYAIYFSLFSFSHIFEVARYAPEILSLISG